MTRKRGAASAASGAFACGFHAVYRSVLVTGLRDFDRGGSRSISGERATHQEPSRPQDRRAGMPVATATAHLRPTEQFLSSAGGDLCTAGLLAATRRTCGLGQRMHSKDAEGAH